MKKILVAITILIASIFTMSAQNNFRCGEPSYKVTSASQSSVWTDTCGGKWYVYEWNKTTKAWVLTRGNSIAAPPLADVTKPNGTKIDYGNLVSRWYSVSDGKLRKPNINATAWIEDTGGGGGSDIPEISSGSNITTTALTKVGDKYFSTTYKQSYTQSGTDTLIADGPITSTAFPGFTYLNGTQRVINKRGWVHSTSGALYEFNESADALTPSVNARRFTAANFPNVVETYVKNLILTDAVTNQQFHGDLTANVYRASTPMYTNGKPSASLDTITSSAGPKVIYTTQPAYDTTGGNKIRYDWSVAVQDWITNDVGAIKTSQFQDRFATKFTSYAQNDTLVDGGNGLWLIGSTDTIYTSKLASNTFLVVKAKLSALPASTTVINSGKTFAYTDATVQVGTATYKGVGTKFKLQDNSIFSGKSAFPSLSATNLDLIGTKVQDASDTSTYEVRRNTSGNLAYFRVTSKMGNINTQVSAETITGNLFDYSSMILEDTFVAGYPKKIRHTLSANGKWTPLSGVYYGQDFGFVGDNITDNSAAWERFIAKTEYNPTLILGGGTFRTTKPFITNKAVTIIGQAPANTFPYVTAGTAGTAIVGNFTNEYVIRFDGDPTGIGAVATYGGLQNIAVLNENKYVVGAKGGAVTINNWGYAFFENLNLSGAKGLINGFATFSITYNSVKFQGVGTLGSHGFHFSSHSFVHGVDVQGADWGITHEGVQLSLNAARVEVCRHGLTLGVDTLFNNALSHAVAINSIIFEANDTALHVNYASSSWSVNSMLIQGTGNSPSGNSDIGILIGQFAYPGNINGAAVSGSGGFTVAGIKIDNAAGTNNYPKVENVYSYNAMSTKPDWIVADSNRFVRYNHNFLNNTRSGDNVTFDRAFSTADARIKNLIVENCVGCGSTVSATNNKGDAQHITNDLMGLNNKYKSYTNGNYYTKQGFFGDSNTQDTLGLLKQLTERYIENGYRVGLNYVSFNPQNGMPHGVSGSASNTSFWSYRNLTSTPQGRGVDAKEMTSVASGAVATISTYIDTLDKFTSFKLFYYDQVGGGQFRVDVDGSPVSTISTANATPQLKVVEFTGLTMAKHTITVTTLDANPVTVFGCQLSNPTKQISFDNYAQSGTTLAQWNTFYSSNPIALQMLDSLKMDNVFINLGTNDITGTSPATLKGYMNTLVTNLKTKTEVVTIAPHKSLFNTATIYKAFDDSLKSLAVTNSNRHISYYDFYGNSHAYLVQKGVLKTDSLHFTTYGGYINAGIIYEFLNGGSKIPASSNVDTGLFLRKNGNYATAALKIGTATGSNQNIELIVNGVTRATIDGNGILTLIQPGFANSVMQGALWSINAQRLRLNNSGNTQISDPSVWNTALTFNNWSNNFSSGNSLWGTFSGTFAPTAASTSFHQGFLMSPALNFTGTANQKFIGTIFYDPSVTSIGNGRHYAAIYKSGHIVVGSGGISPTGGTSLCVGCDTTTVSPNNLNTFGSFGANIVPVTSNYTALATDRTIVCNATNGAITITLPAASTATRREYIITKTDASANTVTCNGIVLSAQNKFVKVQSDGTTWYNIETWTGTDAIGGYTSTATNLTLNNTHSFVEVTATGQTITLPTAVGISGREYTIKLTASGTATIATTSSQTIDGATTYSLPSQYSKVTVVSNGANWLVKN